MVSVHFQGEQFNITVFQVYTPTNNAEEAEVEWFYEDLEKERYTHLNAEFQRIARIDKKVFFSKQCKQIEENNRIISVRFQGKPFIITVVQVYAPTSNAEEAEVKQKVKSN